MVVVAVMIDSTRRKGGREEYEKEGKEGRCV
jgi:hypothetical protein